MSGGAGESEEIVAVLRELGRAVHGGEVAAESRAAALAHLRSALELLAEGEPRLRWYEVDGQPPDATRARNRELSTFSGALNPIAPPMRIQAGSLADGRDALVGSVRLDRLREGPPRSVHGGVIAGLFDEILGGGQRLGKGPPGMTGRLTVRYRRPTPLDTDLEFRVWVHDERNRRVVVHGECVLRGEPDVVTAEAEAIFLRVDFVRLDDMMRDRAEGEVPSPAPSSGHD